MSEIEVGQVYKQRNGESYKITAIRFNPISNANEVQYQNTKLWLYLTKSYTNFLHDIKSKKVKLVVENTTPPSPSRLTVSMNGRIPA